VTRYKPELPGEIIEGLPPPRQSKYQRVLDLDVGQTILFKWQDMPADISAESFNSAIRSYWKRYGRKFSMRTRGEGIYVTRKPDPGWSANGRGSVERLSHG
jgi:hypothetical protein